MRLALAVACLLAVPAAAEAQGEEPPLEDLAADLAYGVCPLFLSGQFSLPSPALTELGFGPIQKQQHPRLGEMSMVSTTRSDGELAFGGAQGKACTVVVSGSRRTAVLAALRERMALTGLEFQPTANPGTSAPGTTVETFRAPIEDQMLYLQLVDAYGPRPVIAAQFFVMDS